MTPRLRALTAIALTAALVFSAPAATARTGEFEPNETSETATPLGPSGSSYAATIESNADADRYELYVSGRDTQVTFSVTNTSTPEGGLSFFLLGVELQDAQGQSVECCVSPIDAGESTTFSRVLEPGRYQLVVDASATFFHEGARTYSFSHQGATIDEPTMQGLCTAAENEVGKAQAKVKRAKKKWRRARIDGTRREVRAAKVKIGRAKRAVRQAKKSTDDFCVVL